MNAVHSAAAFPRQEAHADWQRFESDSDVQRDQFGPKASPLRLYCPVEDCPSRGWAWLCAGEVGWKKGQSQTSRQGHRGHRQEVQEDMPEWSDDRLNIGDFDGKTSNPFLLQGGHALRTPQAVGSLSTAARQGGGQQSQPAPGDSNIRPGLPDMLSDSATRSMTRPSSLWRKSRRPCPQLCHLQMTPSRSSWQTMPAVTTPTSLRLQRLA